jgi:hypothetical protein
MPIDRAVTSGNDNNHLVALPVIAAVGIAIRRLLKEAAICVETRQNDGLIEK